jgi:hypothetical protein
MPELPSVTLTVRVERQGLGWLITCLHCGREWPVMGSWGRHLHGVGRHLAIRARADALASVFRHAAELQESLAVEALGPPLPYGRRG